MHISFWSHSRISKYIIIIVINNNDRTYISFISWWHQQNILLRFLEQAWTKSWTVWWYYLHRVITVYRWMKLSLFRGIYLFRLDSMRKDGKRLVTCDIGIICSIIGITYCTQLKIEKLSFLLKWHICNLGLPIWTPG